MSHTTWSTRWYTILHPVPFSSVLGLGQVISSSSARDCLVRVYQELEPGLELNLCWLCIEFPLLCFIYAFHHHAESIFLLHPPPRYALHALPLVVFGGKWVIWQKEMEKEGEGYTILLSESKISNNLSRRVLNGFWKETLWWDIVLCKAQPVKRFS